LFEAKKRSACSCFFELVKYNIEKAINKSPNPKGLIGFIAFGGLYFVWGAIFCLGGRLKPPKPMPGYVPAYMVSHWRRVDVPR